MREWSLGPGDPLELTLAADARQYNPDYTNDQIWKAILGKKQQPAIDLQTTYGLRAGLMQVYPRFELNGLAAITAAEFFAPPRLNEFYPNYLRFSSSPFRDIDVSFEYWVPASDIVSCRLQVHNLTPVPQEIYIEWIASLNPLEGIGMAPRIFDRTTVLQGETSGLFPIFYLTGGCQKGHDARPSLGLALELQSGEKRSLTFALATTSDSTTSFNIARETVARPWDSELSRLQMVNAGQLVEIETGNPEWDAAMAFSQKTASQLIINSSLHLHNPTFVFTRQPDQGYSWRRDGSDYSHLWSGQTLFESYYLASILLPGGTPLIKGLLENFLSSVGNPGNIDWKPGLAGQRGRLLAPPLLATLAWQIQARLSGPEFLQRIYPELLAFFERWFTPEHDRDSDGFPEWDHPLQSGFEENPAFDRWHTGCQGAEITSTETPQLGAMLYRECQSLIQIAHTLVKREEDVQRLEEIAAILRQRVEACWDSQGALYHYIDRDTHETPKGRLLAKAKGSDDLKPDFHFERPVRLLIHIQTRGKATRRVELTIRGETPAGSVCEIFRPRDILWVLGNAVITTKKVYTVIDEITWQGLLPKDLVQVKTVDYTQEDCTLLLPLWAGIPSQNRAQEMVQKTITAPNRFWLPAGIVGVSRTSTPTQPEVHFPWNQWIGEGLLAYGHRQEAAELVGRLLNTAASNLAQSNCFFKTYNAETGKGQGECSHIDGLAPLGLFLQTLGIELISPISVKINGFNPFTFPVTVKYCGLIITRDSDQATVVFPDGQAVTVPNNTSCLVSL